MQIFSKLNSFIFGYFDPTFFFLIIKIIVFWGDLSGVSAKMATLAEVRVLARTVQRALGTLDGVQNLRVLFMTRFLQLQQCRTGVEICVFFVTTINQVLLFPLRTPRQTLCAQANVDTSQNSVGIQLQVARTMEFLMPDNGHFPPPVVNASLKDLSFVFVGFFFHLLSQIHLNDDYLDLAGLGL